MQEDESGESELSDAGFDCWAGRETVDPICTSDDAGVEFCFCPGDAFDSGFDGTPGESRPPDPTVSLAWEGDNLVLQVTTSAEHGPYLFGLAETGNGDMGWYGEDCIDGVRNDHDVCHSVPENGELILTKAPIADIETEGYTLVGPAVAAGLTYVLVRDTEENAGCWTWGHDTRFYGDPPLSCNEITPDAR